MGTSLPSKLPDFWDIALGDSCGPIKKALIRAVPYRLFRSTVVRNLFGINVKDMANKVWVYIQSPEKTPKEKAMAIALCQTIDSVMKRWHVYQKLDDLDKMREILRSCLKAYRQDMGSHIEWLKQQGFTLVKDDAKKIQGVTINNKIIFIYDSFCLFRYVQHPPCNKDKLIGELAEAYEKDTLPRPELGVIIKDPTTELYTVLKEVEVGRSRRVGVTSELHLMRYADLETLEAAMAIIFGEK